MRRTFTGILVLAAFNSHGQPPAGYYDPAQGLYGDDLRQALHTIISPHTILPNSGMWSYFQQCDARPDGTVWDMYSDVPGGDPAYIYEFVVDQCGNYSGEGDCFNREHSFPQAWYGQGAPMSTDLFHIYPTDAWVNQKRANLAYGTVGNASWTSTNGSQVGPCNWPGCNGTIFEPIDAYKGDLARSYFYMLTRYMPQLTAWASPMMTGGALTPWARQMLLHWHAQDPVSPKETARNNCAYGLQGNRNPYIDQPEWVEMIWGDGVGVNDTEGRDLRMWYHDGRIYWRMDATPSGPVRLQVADMTGRIMHEEMSSASVATVGMLSPGVHIAILETDGGRCMLRFVQQ